MNLSDVVEDSSILNKGVTKVMSVMNSTAGRSLSNVTSVSDEDDVHAAVVTTGHASWTTGYTVSDRDGSTVAAASRFTEAHSSHATSVLTNATSWVADHLAATLSSASAPTAAVEPAPGEAVLNVTQWPPHGTSTDLWSGRVGLGGTVSNVTEGRLLTVEEADDQAPAKSEVKELVYVVIVIAFYSAALLALVILQIRRYYTRNLHYTSFGEGPAEGYALHEEYSENRQLIFQESRRAEIERNVRNMQGVKNGYAIDSIPEHVV